MKRDMDLIRKILLKAEESPIPPYGEMTDPFTIDGYDQDIVTKHVYLLHQAGYITATFNKAIYLCWIESITWQGHDFLDAARNEGIWNKVKDKVSKEVGTVSLEIMKALLVDYTKQKLGIS